MLKNFFFKKVKNGCDTLNVRPDKKKKKGTWKANIHLRSVPLIKR